MCVGSAGMVELSTSQRNEEERGRGSPEWGKGLSCLEHVGSAIHSKKSSSEAVALMLVTLVPHRNPTTPGTK